MKPLFFKPLLISLAVGLLLQCTHSVASGNGGGSTTTDNAQVSGRALYSDGRPATGALVRIRPIDFVRPISGVEPDSITRHDTTINDSGWYFIDSLGKGNYHIEINDDISAASLVEFTVAAKTDTASVLPPETLTVYQTITGKIDSTLLGAKPLYVQVYGLDRIELIDSATGAYTIPDLPPGTYRLRVVSTDTAFKPVVIDTAKPDTSHTLPPAAGSWIRTNGPYPGGWISGFVVGQAGTSSGRIFAADYVNGLFVSSDNGASWDSAFNGFGANRQMQTVALSPDGNTLYAATLDGVYKSGDNGVTWSSITTGFSGVDQYDVKAIVVAQNSLGGLNLLAATSQGGVYLSASDGASWAASNTGLSSLNVTALVATGATVYAGTLTSGVFLSVNGGASWAAMNSGLSNTSIICLAVNPAGNTIYAGTATGIFASADTGKHWKELVTGYTFSMIDAIIAVPGAGGGVNLFAGAYGCGVLLSTDSGATWHVMNTGLMDNTVKALAAKGPYLFAGADGSGVFRSTSNGADWSASNDGLGTPTVWSLAASGANIFAGTFNGFFRLNYDALNWSKVNSLPPSFNMTRLSVSADGMNMFSVGNGAVFRSTDNGVSWTAAGSAAWTSNAVSVLSIIGNKLFAGAGGSATAADNGVFISTDNGASWTPANMGFNLSTVDVKAFAAVALSPTDTEIFAATGKDGIFVSKNFGASWTAVNSGLTTLDIAALGVCGTTIFAGTPTGGIFYSTDNGVNWTEVTTGVSPIENVRAFAVTGDTVFATGGYGVYLSSDKGVSWTAFSNNGLAGVSVNALLIHGNYLYAATTFYGVWKVLLR